MVLEKNARYDGYSYQLERHGGNGGSRWYWITSTYTNL
jgi:hypothetical protein